MCVKVSEGGSMYVDSPYVCEGVSMYVDSRATGIRRPIAFQINKWNSRNANHIACVEMHVREREGERE